MKSKFTENMISGEFAPIAQTDKNFYGNKPMILTNIKDCGKIGRFICKCGSWQSAPIRIECFEYWEVEISESLTHDPHSEKSKSL